MLQVASGIGFERYRYWGIGYWAILGDIGNWAICVLDAVPNAIFAVTQTAAGASQWISISYVVGGGAADSGMKVDGTQHASLKASPPHTCHLAHQTHVMIGRWAAVLRSHCSVRRSISVSLR